MRKVFFLFLILCITEILPAQSYYFDTVLRGIRSPTVFAFFPNGNIIINQKLDSSKVYNSSNGQFISCFWNFRDSLQIDGEAGLLGVCLDPNYAVNRYIYIYYIKPIKSFRVVRFTEVNNVGTNPFMVFNDSVGITGFQSNVHYGGNIHFGPGNKLYITVGDHGRDTNAQSLYSFKGKILRINADGTIPTDNPFYDDGNPKTGRDDRIWAMGLRNAFDFTFSPFNDSIYSTENGGFANDEVNFIRKGKNYGWPICQGYCVPYNPLYRQPMDTIGGVMSQAYGPTGILVYNGSIFPELNNKAIIGGVGGGPVKGIIKLNLANPPFYDTASSHQIISTMHGLTCIKQGADGYIYFTTYAASTGRVFKMMPPLGVTNNSIPALYSLEQNYPNPFNPVTSIKYSLPKQAYVTLTIYDLVGREIKALVNQTKQAGNYEVEWNAEAFPSGVYICKFNAHDYTEQKKMVLLK